MITPLTPSSTQPPPHTSALAFVTLDEPRPLVLMKKFGGLAPRTHLFSQRCLVLTNSPDLYAELVRSSRVEQEVQEDHVHHGVQGHHEANWVPDLKNQDCSPLQPSISQENENYMRHMTQPPPNEQQLQLLRHTHCPHQEAPQEQA
jgi:hypothetical protein